MKTPLRLAIGHCLLAILLGCSSPYASNGLFGGYSDTRLARDVFRINFQGNGYTSAERTQDFALRRAAELCATNGFPWFAIINESSSERSMAHQLPGHAYSSGNVAAYGNTAFYSGQTTYVPGPTIHAVFPKAGLLVQGFATKPEGVYVFEAAFVLESLSTKYRIRPPASTVNPNR